MGSTFSRCISCCIPQPAGYGAVVNLAPDDEELDDSALGEQVPMVARVRSTPDDALSAPSDPELLENIRLALSAAMPSSESSDSSHSDGSSVSLNDCCTAMKNGLALLGAKDESASVVIDELLKLERKRLSKAGKLAKRNFAANIISMALEAPQQEELYEILAGLPSAVLGDTDAKAMSRVLINVREDVRTAIAGRKLSVSKRLSDIYVLRDHFTKILQGRKDQEEIICRMIGALPPTAALRAVLQNVLLIKVIPPDFDDRDEVLMDIFPSEIVERQLDKQQQQQEVDD